LAQNTRVLVRTLFKDDFGKPFECHSYQVKIIRTIIYGRAARTLCWATTRAGKSLAVALGIIILATYFPGRKIRIIAPTKDHTSIIMNYITQHIPDHPLIISRLELPQGSERNVERLRKQLSKSRITFKDNTEIMIVTASIALQGRSLIGQGGTDIIGDELEQIPSEIVKTKVLRMLGDSPDANAFFISNPSAKGFMYEARSDSNWDQIKIGWEIPVKEGRLTKEFVDQQRIALGPIGFKIWYDSEYPDDYEDTLILWKWIEYARDRKPFDMPKNAKVVWGLDVAELGKDLTVLTRMLVANGKYNMTHIFQWGKKETMETVGLVQHCMDKVAKESDKEHDKSEIVYIDATGVGAGVWSRLKERGYKAIRVMVGGAAEKASDSEMFLNKKAQYYWNLRKLFEENRISITDHREMIIQLSGFRYEYTSSKKIVMIDPGAKTLDGVKVGNVKSPDFCFDGNTLVKTVKGNIPIKDINIGDYVITPFGKRKVTNKNSRYAKNILSLKATNGINIITTYNHSFFNGKVFKPIITYNNQDKLVKYTIPNMIKWKLKRLLYTKGKNIGFRELTQNITTATNIMAQEKKDERKSHYIDECGKTITTKKSLKDILSITKTKTHSTISPKILRFFRGDSTKEIMYWNGSKIRNMLKKTEKVSLKLKKKLKNGTEQKKAKNGTGNTGLNLLGLLRNILINVLFVVISFILQELIKLNIVLQNVGLKAITIETAELIKTKTKVYNITVDEDQVYYANDILVSNSDSLMLTCCGQSTGPAFGFT